jgi:3-keto-disaccharide hydrolase
MNLIAKAASALTLLVAAVAYAALVRGGVSQIPAPPNEPKIIDPGPIGGPPSDAIVLFDGKDLSQWSSKNGGPAKWDVKDGVITVTRAGDIVSKQEFGDVQLHIEWATPSEVKGEGQGRGNSGVFLQSRYEVQVLDSYQNKTYFHGQAGGVYKQYAPLVNACRKPGEWQTYDIIFHAPAFDDAGNVTRRATMTVLHNGVLIQDNVQVLGTTTHEGDPKYTKHPPRAPIQLQDHGDAVRYRNIWVRPL